jgi:hypothetical protein
MITRPEESYRLWYFVVFFYLETSRMKMPWPTLGRIAKKKRIFVFILQFSYIFSSWFCIVDWILNSAIWDSPVWPHDITGTLPLPSFRQLRNSILTLWLYQFDGFHPVVHRHRITRTCIQQPSRPPRTIQHHQPRSTTFAFSTPHHQGHRQRTCSHQRHRTSINRIPQPPSPPPLC